MKFKQLMLLTITFIATLLLVACGSQSGTSSGNATLSGTYSYEGDTFYDDSEESELTIYYELEVKKKKSTYDIIAIDEDGNPVQYLYSETITIDENKQIIKDYKGNKFEYSATKDSVTLPDLVGDTGDKVTLIK
ncbi:hypothetical protein [Streptococcus equinus]|uniref:hypothetical protein n=1 Tax=Streptococcus equinus TaxID=1335 RepID=UPI0008E15430|nr:hypothetical protein [Streptococcus equinus]SFC06686.1 hypothetical protein SAMN05216408_0851 [Streptococcus equinus]